MKTLTKNLFVVVVWSILVVGMANMTVLAVFSDQPMSGDSALGEGVVKRAPSEPQNSPPTVEITYPLPSETEDHTGLLTITWEATDKDNDLLSFSVYYAESGAEEDWTNIASNLQDQYSCNWDTDAVEDGLYMLRVLAFDGINTVGATVDPIWVYHPDPPSVSIIFPVGGEILRNNVSIFWEIDDPDSDEFIVNGYYQTSDLGNLWIKLFSTNSTKSGTYIWNSYPTDGLVRLRINVNDHYNTVVAYSNYFTLDQNFSPEISWVGPTGTITKSPIWFNLQVDDQKGDPVSVSVHSFLLNKTTLKPASPKTILFHEYNLTTPSNIRFNWEMDNLPNGLYEFVATVSDGSYEKRVVKRLEITIPVQPSVFINNTDSFTLKDPEVLNLTWTVMGDSAQVRSGLIKIIGVDVDYNTSILISEPTKQLNWVKLNIKDMPKGSYVTQVILYTKEGEAMDRIHFSIIRLVTSSVLPSTSLDETTTTTASDHSLASPFAFSITAITLLGAVVLLKWKRSPHNKN